MTKIITHLSSGYFNLYEKNELDYILTRSYLVLKRGVEANCDEVLVNNAGVHWIKSGKVIGTLPTGTVPNPTFQEVFPKILKRDNYLNRYVKLIEQHEDTLRFHISFPKN